MNTHKLFLISALLLIGLASLQAQKRFLASAGLEIEELPVETLRHDFMLKKQVRLEFQSALTKRLFLSSGLRYSWNSEEHEEIHLSFIAVHPAPPIKFFHSYSFSTQTLSIPIGLSFDLLQDKSFPLAVYANAEPCFSRGHYDDLYFEMEDGPDTSIAFEGGFRFPIYSGKHFGVFMSPYLRIQNRRREIRTSHNTEFAVRKYDTSLMQIIGLRLGVAIQ